jgi:DNA repair ATPase RecN
MSLKLPILELAPPKRGTEEYYWKPSETEAQPAKTVDAEGLLAKANNLFKAKKYQEALTTAESVLEYDSKNSRAIELVNASNYQMEMVLSDGKTTRMPLHISTVLTRITRTSRM